MLGLPIVVLPIACDRQPKNGTSELAAARASDQCASCLLAARSVRLDRLRRVAGSRQESWRTQPVGWRPSQECSQDLSSREAMEQMLRWAAWSGRLIRPSGADRSRILRSFLPGQDKANMRARYASNPCVAAEDEDGF